MSQVTDTSPFPSAAAVYSRAYEVLKKMAAAGHVTVSRIGRRTVCHPSEDMNDLIDALNRGDEERIKGMLLLHHTNEYLAAAG